jgi:hypothetical protein
MAALKISMACWLIAEEGRDSSQDRGGSAHHKRTRQ